MTERKMASIRRINNIDPIQNADAIELATVDGWKVVIRKGEYTIGDLAIYCEIDSWIPHAIAPFLSKGSNPRLYDNVEGERLRTVKLRGQLSQGLLLPLSVLGNNPESLTVGIDVAEQLNIQKYEPPISAELAGLAKGTFPRFIKKTDQERCQNLGHEIFVDNKDAEYEVTLKMDGTSFTAYFDDNDNDGPGVDGVCSRNLELKIHEIENHNSFVLMYIESGMQAVLRKLRRNCAIQGEMLGAGIQGNKEGFKSTKLFVFNIYDTDNQCDMSPKQRHDIMEQMWGLGLNKDMVHHVPVIAHTAKLYDTLGITNMEELLKFAEGPSLNALVREGLVYKRIDGAFSFKTISNVFLLKEKD